jgi:hypothetical protein
MERILKRNLYNLQYNTVYSSKSAIYKKFKDKFPKNDVKKWLQGQKILQKYAVARKKFPRPPVLAFYRGHVMQMDLAFFLALKQHQKNKAAYCLCVIDVLTKELYAFPMKTKKPDEIILNLKKLFKKIRPKILSSDLGGEFKNKLVSDFLSKHQVQQFFTYNEIHASVVERVIRELKGKLYKHMDYTGKKDWVTPLQLIVDSLNNTVHSTTKLAPSQTVSKEAQKTAFINTYKNKIGFSPPESDIKINDAVRISHLRSKFSKSYFGNWTEEEFLVSKILPREKINLYIIRDKNNQEITGKFTRQELMPT